MIIEEFQHPNFDPLSKDKKSKWLKITCDQCGKIHERGLIYYNKLKENELFDSDYCNNCWRAKLNNRELYKETMRRVSTNIWSSDEKRNSMSELIKSKCKETGYMIGDKNPMRNADTRKLTGMTRSSRMTDDEKRKYSLLTKKAWEDGKFIGVTTGKCKWYDYTHSNGKIYKVQGRWELKFIEWLDLNNMEFKCHVGRIPYIDDNEKERNYYPDFYINEWKSYIDIKSDYTYRGQERKFEILLNTSPVPIKLMFKRDLANLGIKI